MSDSNDDLKSDTNDKDEGICRDFSRGSCERKYCRFKHGAHSMANLNFCHDFQNNFCPRPMCKFIHCSADDEAEYKRSGKMTNQILAEATRKNQLPGLQPICNQYRKGVCRRINCKYRHLTKEEEEAEILGLINNNNQLNGQVPTGFAQEIQALPVASINGLHGYNQVTLIPNDFGSCAPPPLRKRRLMSDDPLDSDRNEHVFKGYCAGTPPAPILNRTIMLEEEISLLHKEINQLKRQVQDLTATNEFLLDQNATLRVSNKHNGAVASNPTPATPQQVIRTVTANVANVPVSLATVPVSLATVPVSLTTVTTCNPVSISAVPSVSIASPAQLLAPSQQILVTTNPSNQLAIANSSQAQLAIGNGQQLTVTNVPQRLTLTGQAPQQIAITSQNQQQLALASQNQQQLALASQNQQQLALASQNQQQLALASQQNQQQLALASQNQQQLALANQQNQQQLALATQNQQQLALASQQNQQQLALASQNQQQIALANQQNQQQLALASQNQQQLALASQNQQLLAQQNLASIQTSQPIATQAMVSYPIVTHSINHAIH